MCRLCVDWGYSLSREVDGEEVERETEVERLFFL